MFGRKKDDGETAPAETAEPGETAAPSPPQTNPKVAAVGRGESGGKGFRPEISRRVMEIPGAPPPRSRGTETPDPKTLIVGREISLSGDITTCDKLIVEGKVEANLSDSRFVEIAETGIFKGTIEIDEAEISGRFEGRLTVKGRLHVRASGRVYGDVEYGEIEIERGGQIAGDVKSSAAPRQAAPVEAARVALAD